MPQKRTEAQHLVRAWTLIIVTIFVILAVKAPSALVALGVAVTALIYFIGRVIGLFFGA